MTTATEKPKPAATLVESKVWPVWERKSGRAEDSSRWPAVTPWARVGRVLVLMASDALALSIAGALAYLLWALRVRGQPPAIYLELWVFLLVFLIGYASGGLYPGFGLGAVEILRRLSVRTSFLFLAVAATSFVLRAPHHYARASFAIAFLASLILVPLCRFAVLALAQRWSWWREPAVVVGENPIVSTTVRALSNALTLGFDPSGVVSRHGDVVSGKIAGLPVLGTLDALPEVAAEGIHVVLVAEGEQPMSQIELDALQQHFRQVIVVRGYGDVPVEGVLIRNLGGVLGIEFRNQLLRPWNRAIKRGLDLVLGSLALVLVTPIIAFAAVAVKVASPGPAFFGQKRGGLNGKEIVIWKLRTMHVDAEKRLESYLEMHPEARRAWKERFKLEDDPRVIPVIGRFLRRFSIDELPQLWQVVIGEMSLVGPRPFPEYHLRRLSPEASRLRARVRPGLTGLWQVMARGQGSIETQEGFDIYYIKNWSLWMDLYIVARTVIVVATGRGAH